MAKQTRTVLAAKNFIWASVGDAVNLLLSFVSRTIFIYTLGTVYLGVNGLFSNVLGMLSLAELGVGATISFSLYKPLAENDINKIQAIINFYRTAYRLIAAVVAAMGICIIPFLSYIVKGADRVDNIVFIYCLFLFNTVTSYLISYKSTLLRADQRNYLITNINTVVRILTVIIQSIMLIMFKDFIIYLLANAVIQLISKIYVNRYTDKRYPYIRGRNSSRLPDADKKTIFTKIKAMMIHKLGDVAINQTDNIITSAVINVIAVGLVSNFTMIIASVNSIVTSFFSASVAGLGNIIATESNENRLRIFKKYDFLGFCFFGWTAICLAFLLSPFITVWIGADKLVDKWTVLLLCVNYYFTGQRVSLGNIKAAAGVFEQDVWMPFAQAAVNIAISIMAAKMFGLPGIYIGTFISSFVPNIGRPIIVYKYVFGIKSSLYFKQYIKRILLMLISGGLIVLSDTIFHIDNVLLTLVFRGIACIIIPTAVIWAVYHRTEEWNYCINTVKMLVRRRTNG